MTTLIKNVTVVDGSGSPPFKGDVLLRGAHIVAVGDFPSYNADEIIYGNELFLSSGFIDVNVSSDRTHAIFFEPEFNDFLKQGITTVLLGQCGFSLAPSLYGMLHEHDTWKGFVSMNANWRTFAEFLDELSRTYRFGLHVGSLVGHRSMREDIVRTPGEFRKLSASELRIFRTLLEKSIKEGAFGFSTGLGYVPYDKTPYHELRALTDVVARRKGVYMTHIRNETDEIFPSVREVVQLAQDVSVRTIISHFRPFLGFEEEFMKALAYMEEKFTRAHVYFDVNPFPYSAVRADSFLPKKIEQLPLDVALTYLHDEKEEKELLATLRHVDPKNAFISTAPGMSFLQGVSLYAFAQNRKVSGRRALLEFMKTTKLRGVLFYKNLDRLSIEKALASSQSLVSTNSSHFAKNAVFRPDRAVGTFPEFLRTADALGMSIEKTVAKITSIPASLLGLEKRGMIAPGFFADIVLFSKDGGISSVFVDGVRVVSDGHRTSERAESGGMLRKTPLKA